MKGTTVIPETMYISLNDVYEITKKKTRRKPNYTIIFLIQFYINTHNF